MTNSVRTQKFLRLIAKRLSGREDCRQIQYEIGIGCMISATDVILPKELTEKYIVFKPDVYTYRDNHHRKDIDHFRVTDWIITKYFPELVQGRDEYGQLLVDTSQFVRGVYQYQLSFNGARRRWVKRKRV